MGDTEADITKTTYRQMLESGDSLPTRNGNNLRHASFDSFEGEHGMKAASKMKDKAVILDIQEIANEGTNESLTKR
jgi:hypothetical protein